jgi:hypothetical protein
MVKYAVKLGKRCYGNTLPRGASEAIAVVGLQQDKIGTSSWSCWWPPTGRWMWMERRRHVELDVGEVE